MATAASSGPDRRLLALAGAALVAVLVVVALIATRDRGGSDDTATGDDGSETPLTPEGQGEGEADSGDASQARFAWQAELGEETIGDVTASDTDHAYIVDDRGLATAFDLATGEQAWQVDLGDESTGTHPLLAGGLVVIGISEPEATHALDPATGEQVWRTPDVWLSNPVVAGEVVVDHSGDIATGLSLTDGSIAWQQDIGLWAWGNVTVAGGLLVTGSDDGRVAALDPATGSAVWSHEVPRGDVDIERIDPLGEDAVVAVDEDGHVTAMSLTDGAERWSQDLTATGVDPLVMIGDKLVLQSESGLTFVDPATGAAAGGYEGGSADFAAAPDGSPTMLVLSTEALTSVGLDGQPAWSAPVPIPALELDVGGGAALVHDYDGNLAVLTLAT